MPPRRRFSFVRITAARDWALDDDSVLVLNGFIRPVHISRDKVPKCRHHLLFSGHALLPQGRRRSPLDRDFQRRGEKRISKPNLAEKYEAMKLKSTTVLSMLIRDGFYLGIFRKRIAGREILFLLSTHAAAKFKRFFFTANKVNWVNLPIFPIFTRLTFPKIWNCANADPQIRFLHFFMQHRTFFDCLWVHGKIFSNIILSFFFSRPISWRKPFGTSTVFTKPSFRESKRMGFPRNWEVRSRKEEKKEFWKEAFSIFGRHRFFANINLRLFYPRWIAAMITSLERWNLRPLRNAYVHLLTIPTSMICFQALCAWLRKKLCVLKFAFSA